MSLAIMKTKITFIVPIKLQDEIRKHVIHDGYGLRGKSKWISEAVEDLIALNDFVSLVDINNEMKSLEKMETIIIEEEMKVKLEKACIEVRKKHPMIEGVKSRVIRTSILQRIIRSTKNVK